MSQDKNNRATTGVVPPRRQFLANLTLVAGAAGLLRPRAGWAADEIDSRVADIVAKTIGIDTHNHIDVPLTVAEMPGPDIDLVGEIKRSGLSAICMTFARHTRKTSQR